MNIIDEIVKLNRYISYFDNPIIMDALYCEYYQNANNSLMSYDIQMINDSYTVEITLDHKEYSPELFKKYMRCDLFDCIVKIGENIIIDQLIMMGFRGFKIKDIISEKDNTIKILSTARHIYISSD